MSLIVSLRLCGNSQEMPTLDGVFRSKVGMLLTFQDTKVCLRAGREVGDWKL